MRNPDPGGRADQPGKIARPVRDDRHAQRAGSQNAGPSGPSRRGAAWLTGGTSQIVRELVEQVIVDDKRIIIKVRRGALLGGDVPSDALDQPSASTIELTTAVDYRQRGVGTKLLLPGLGQHSQELRCDPALIKAIARGRAWFEELATGRARSLQHLAKRDGISRRYIRRLVGLAFLSPQLVESILQGRQPVELTPTRLTELDLPLDWTEQHKLLAT